MGCILTGTVLRPILFLRVCLVGLKNGGMKKKGEKMVGVGVCLRRENMKDFGGGSESKREKGNKNFGNNVPLDILFFSFSSFPMVILFFQFSSSCSAACYALLIFFSFTVSCFCLFLPLLLFFPFNLYFFSSFVLGYCAHLFILNLFFNKVLIHTHFFLVKI